MERTAVAFGFSQGRVLVGLGILFLLLLFAVPAFLSIFSGGWLERVYAHLNEFLIAKNHLPSLIEFLLSLMGTCLFTIGIFISPFSNQLGMLEVVYQHLTGVNLWILLVAGQALLLLWVNYRKMMREPDFWRVENLVRTSRPVFIFFTALDVTLYLCTIYFDLEQFVFVPFFILIILLALAGKATIFLKYREGGKTSEIDSALNMGIIFCAVFIIYRLTSIYVGQPNSPAKSYFYALADAWLHGRLYLENLTTTHDLTLFHDRWYVPNPPLAAILMAPWIALRGLSSMNTVVFSIFFGSLNATLVFRMLERFSWNGWTNLNFGGNLGLTALLAFGSAHWYLAIGGEMWFVSQTLTVTMVVLAVCIAAAGRSPWWSGIALGLAALARPNILTAVPILFGIFVQKHHDDGKPLHSKEIFKWGFQTGVPFLASVLLLLGYNQIRFENPLDFGYLTENVADFMAADLQTYGTFHPHFILRNLKVMFLALPKWSDACRSYLPSVQGLSIFLVTPALIYLPASFKRKPWILWAWISILTILAPLLMYYNTGAWQFGYKYLLDFIIPVIALLAVSAGKRLPWGLRLLILASILINAYGVLWWNGMVCRG